jgi:hypothetical protein
MTAPDSKPTNGAVAAKPSSAKPANADEKEWWTE